LIVAMTVLGAGLGAVAGASVFAMRSTNDALLRERAIVLAVATLDSLTALPAPTGGTIRTPDIRLTWVVAPGGGGGVIRLSAMPTASRSWVQHFRARFLAPVPALPP
jgi:hypothetical protein